MEKFIKCDNTEKKTNTRNVYKLPALPPKAEIGKNRVAWKMRAFEIMDIIKTIELKEKAQKLYSEIGYYRTNETDEERIERAKHRSQWVVLEDDYDGNTFRPSSPTVDCSNENCIYTESDDHDPSDVTSYRLKGTRYAFLCQNCLYEQAINEELPEHMMDVILDRW